MQDEFADIIKQLEKVNAYKEVHHGGLTPEEIEEVMQAQGVKRLPGLYISFLLALGKSTYPLTDVIAGGPELKTLKQRAFEVYDLEDPPFHLPSDAFVFCNYLDSMIRYFLTDNEDDNPPVYRYDEGGYFNGLEFEHLSDYYLAILKE